jgi:hypothetical protein
MKAMKAQMAQMAHPVPVVRRAAKARWASKGLAVQKGRKGREVTQARKAPSVDLEVRAQKAQKGR